MMSAPPSYSFAVAIPSQTVTDDIQHHTNVNSRAASSTRLSPASSTVSDSARSWTSAALHGEPKRPRTKSTSPANEASSAANESQKLLFVTVNNPKGFKGKETMQRVRKQAMNNYLEKNSTSKPGARNESNARKASKSEGQRSRQRSDDSTATEQSSAVLEEGGSLLSKEEALRIFKGKKRGSNSSVKESSASSMAIVEDGMSAQLVRSVTSMSETSFSPLDTISIMHPPPMWSPMRPGKLPFDIHPVGPFKSIGRPLDPFRAMHQASHARVSVEELKFHCSRAFGTRAMGMHWIPTLIKSPHAFLSTLSIASAHLDAINHRSIESVQTLALRQEVMHLISQHLVNPASQVDDFNIISVTQLICSEIIAGNHTILTYHESGIDKMVAQRGGLDKLGVNGRLAPTLSWVCLQSSILREARPKKLYQDFAAFRPARPYPNTATIPENPFWCPRADFESLKRSQRTLQRTVDLLKDVRQMTRLFLGETTTTQQDEKSEGASPEKQRLRDQQMKTLYKKMASLPAVADMAATTVLTQREWTYEACRIAAVIQGMAMVKRIPLSGAFARVAEDFVRSREERERKNSTWTTRSDGSVVSPKTMSTTTATAPQHNLQLQTQIYPGSSDYRIDSPVYSFSAHSQAPSQQTSYFPSTSTLSTSSSSSSLHTLHTQPPQPQQQTSSPAISPATALLTHIQTVLDSSDLSETWSDLAGVLYWLTLIVCAASSSASTSSPSTSSSSLTTSTSPFFPTPTTKSVEGMHDIRVLHKWFRALSVRCGIRLCFEHEDAVLGTLGQAGRVVESCKFGEEREGGERKRRRV